MDILEQIKQYRPWNAQEAADQALMLQWLEQANDLFSRGSPAAHFTASAWVVSPDRRQVLMAYHNLYDSWAWLGGHADGERDLLSVALREACEESGLKHVQPVSEDIFSVESLPVFGHIKRGKYVSTHIHLNVTYLLEADEHDALHEKPDENSGVKWFGLDEALENVTEEWMRDHIYQKLNQKLRML